MSCSPLLAFCLPLFLQAPWSSHSSIQLLALRLLVFPNPGDPELEDYLQSWAKQGLSPSLWDMHGNLLVMAFDPPIPCSWLPLLVFTMKIRSPISGMWFYIMSFIQRLHSWLYVRGPQAIVGEVRSGSSASENSVCEYNHSVDFFNFFPISPRPKNEKVKGNT